MQRSITRTGITAPEHVGTADILLPSPGTRAWSHPFASNPIRLDIVAALTLYRAFAQQRPTLP